VPGAKSHVISLVFVGILMTAGCLTSLTGEESDETRCDRQTATSAVGLDVRTPAENLDEDAAIELASDYENAYIVAHRSLHGGELGASVQSSDVSESGAGFLVTLEMVFGGSYTTEGPPAETTRVTSTNDTADTETTTSPSNRVFVDDFYTVYYYVSAAQIVRHRQTNPPANPKTDGEVLYCAG